MKHAPINADSCDAEWIETRRAIIARDGYAARAGEVGVDLAGTPYTIELKSLTTNEWGRLTLPGGGTVFATAADRDAVLVRLQRSQPDPEFLAKQNPQPSTQ